MYEVLDLIWPAISALASVAFGSFIAYVLKKIKNETISNTFKRLAEGCAIAVRDVEQTYIKACRDAQDPNSQGGIKITEEERRNALFLAKASAKAYIGMKGVKILLKSIGIDKFDSVLSSSIEAAHYEMKKSDPMKD